MKAMSPTAFWKIVFVVSAFALIAVGMPTARIEAQEPYKVCASMEYTGAVADLAQSSQVAFEIARDQINAQGGILGRPVELHFRDDKVDPDEGVRLLKEFHLKIGCDAYMLAPVGIVQTPQLRYAKENNLLAFAQQGQDMVYLNDLIYPYYFIMGPTAMQEAKGLALYVAGKPELKTYATIAPDYTWGHSNAEGFVENIKTMRPDMEMVGQYWPPTEETEFSSYVTAIMANKPDVLVTWLFGTTFVGFIKQAEGFGLLKATRVLAWNEFDAVFTSGKDIPSGVTFEMDNEYWTNRMGQNPYYDQFEKEYTARRGRPTALWANQDYDRFMTLMQGIKKAGSFDKDQIAAAIEGSTFMTLRGPRMMRPIDHALTTSVYFGTTRYDEELGYADFEDIVEIPYYLTMVPDEEYVKYREEKGITFQPIHKDWWKELPWAE